jgi:hypothetical protein
MVAAFDNQRLGTETGGASRASLFVPEAAGCSSGRLTWPVVGWSSCTDVFSLSLSLPPRRAAPWVRFRERRNGPLELGPEPDRRRPIRADHRSRAALRDPRRRHRRSSARAAFRIDYALPVRCSARICIYDVSGRRRATVVDGPADPGLHTVEFDPARCDGGGLETGVYFVTLEHCGAALANKLVVLR